MKHFNNTQSIIKQDKSIDVILHGSRIATIWPGVSIKLYDGDPAIMPEKHRRSATTCRRLNQTLQALGANARVNKVAGDWVVTVSGHEMPFIEGFTVAL